MPLLCVVRRDSPSHLDHKEGHFVQIETIERLCATDYLVWTNWGQPLETKFLSFGTLNGILVHSIGTEAHLLIPVGYAVSSFYDGPGPVILILQLAILCRRVTIGV